MLRHIIIFYLNFNQLKVVNFQPSFLKTEIVDGEVSFEDEKLII